jgi:putative hemolysin
VEDPLSTLELIVAVVCFLAVAFLSLSEYALLSTNLASVERLIQGRRKGARALKNLLESDQDYLSTIMVSINVCILLASFCITSYAMNHGLTHRVHLVSLLVAAGFVAFAELSPKTYGFYRSESAALVVARPVKLLTSALGWLTRFVTAVGNFVCGILGIEPLHRRHFITEHDIRVRTDVAVEEGAIEQGERELIENIMEFPDRTTGEIRVPRTEMVCVDADATLDEAITVIQRSGHSRLPAFRGSLDNIVGLLYATDVLICLSKDSCPTRITEMLRPTFFVPDTKKIDELFREMRQRKVHIAIVLDEYGGTDGLVTIEDLLEEIVGEVVDEHDHEPPDIIPLDNDSFLVAAGAEVEVLAEVLGLELPEGDYNTVGGLALELFGRIPEVGESVALDRLTLSVQEMDGPRIVKLRVTKATAGDQ